MLNLCYGKLQGVQGEGGQRGQFSPKGAIKKIIWNVFYLNNGMTNINHLNITGIGPKKVSLLGFLQVLI
jgi:hypothetical protein